MNTTTLNTTTLDGGIIIKKGGGGTPTPPSGGSGESGGSSNYVYYKHRIVASGALSSLWQHSQLVKVSIGSETFICTPYDASMFFEGAQEDIKLEDYIEEVCIDFSLKIKFPGEEFTTIEELVGVDENNLEFITKEQFYSLD